MTREFSFKAWHKTQKTMIPNCDQGFEGDVFNWLNEGQPLEILQATGFKDDNGTEIFDGDILRCGNDSWTGLVSFNGNKGSWECRAYRKGVNSVTTKTVNGFIQLRKMAVMGALVVAGNKYENPELIK